MVKRSCLMWCLAVLLLHGVAALELLNQESLSNSTETPERNSRFFSLFSVVRFSNDQCTGSTNYTGTCMTSVECSAEGGTASGSCASGFGVCCIFSISTCGSSSTRNCSYITNPSVLQATQTCTYTINKFSSDVCQIRLDFYSLSIANPTAGTSVCDNDKFVVTGAGNTAPTICGRSNAGQHMYFDVASSSSIKLNFLLSTSTTTTATSRSWSIKATQLPCNSLVTAPPGCLQYFRDLSGTITSFNYDTGSPAVSRKHLASQDYEICIRTEQNYCTICYTLCSGLTPTTDAYGISTSSPAGRAVVNAGCTLDYLLIPGGYNQASVTTVADRFCGSQFSATDASTTSTTICSARKPFRLHFFTDGGATAATDAEGTDETGFCLKYNQSPC